MSIDNKSLVRNHKCNDRVLSSCQETDPPQETKSPELSGLLEKVKVALQAGNAQQALDLIVRSHHGSPWAMNAKGVCQLRMGKNNESIDIFRRLTLHLGTLALREDVPVIFKINFATALLADHRVNGCLTALAEIRSDSHPAVLRLRAAISEWKSRLNLWDRIDWCLGGEPSRPLNLDWQLGELE